MRKIPAFVAAMMLVTYGYLFATTKPAPIWEPSPVVCIIINGWPICIDWPDDDE